jgi:hypothetical protein
MTPKIAVLYYGHVRNNDEMYLEQLENVFNHNDCDIFIYTSRYESSYYKKLPAVMNKNDLYQRFGDRIKSLEVYEDNLEDMIECKKWMKEKHKIYLEKRKTDKYEPHTRCLNWVYKQKKAYDNMLEYAKQNNINYDLVFTFRSDLRVTEKVNFDNIKNGKVSIGGNTWDYNDRNIYGIIDFFIYASPKAISKYISLYDKFYDYNNIESNAFADNAKDCFHPVRQIVAHFKSQKKKFISTNKTQPIKLMPESVCHKPRTGEPKCAILLIGHFTEICKFTCKIQLERLICQNKCDLFIYTSKKRKYRGIDIKVNNPEITKEEIAEFYENYEGIREIKFFEDSEEEMKECDSMLKSTFQRFEENKKHQDGTTRSNYKETMGQWHKLYRCNEMLRDFEKKNGNKYNLVMKLRPDLYITKNVLLNEIMDKYRPKDNINKTMFGWCDVVYLTSPENMNWISKLINYYYTYNNKDNNTRHDSQRWIFAHETQFFNHCYAFDLAFVNRFNGLYKVNIIRKLEEIENIKISIDPNKESDSLDNNLDNNLE